MKYQIHRMRQDIHGLVSLMENGLKVAAFAYSGYVEFRNNNYGYTKQVDKSIDCLLFAKAWLGKMLQELGETTPYANDGSRKTVEDIERSTDTKELNFDQESSDTNAIEKVDYVRERIKQNIAEVKDISYHPNDSPSREFAIARTNAYNYLCEARFWLGFELQRIKKSNS